MGGHDAAVRRGGPVASVLEAGLRQQRAVLRDAVALALSRVHENRRVLGHRQRARLVFVDERVVDDQQSPCGQCGERVWSG